METAEQKTLLLFLPDWSDLDSLRRSSSPVWLWPVGNQPLLFHWMDWAVRQGYKRVELATADRPNEIRNALEGGHFWSLPVEVRSLRESVSPGHDYLQVTGLPVEEGKTGATPDSPGALLREWWAWNLWWLGKDHAAGPRVEQKHATGAWVGPGVRIHPEARITPPVWIGGRSEVGKSSHLGPNIIIGERCVVDEDVIMKDSMLLSGSYAGSHIGLNRMIADGGVLLDVDKSVRVDIPEAFVLGRPEKLAPPPGVASRITALIFWVALALPALFLRGTPVTRESILLPTGDVMSLREGNRGPLLIRRWSWLLEVIRGRFHWFGVLPRTSETLSGLPSETAERIRGARIGVFSLADAHGVHHPHDDEEWVHAAYQALAEPAEIRKTLLKSLWSLLTLNPASRANG